MYVYASVVMFVIKGINDQTETRKTTAKALATCSLADHAICTLLLALKLFLRLLLFIIIIIIAE